MNRDKEFGLKDAYSLETPEDSKRLYRDWAETYDESFAQQRGYNYPAHLAEVLNKRYQSTDLAVLDVGAGTGLVAQALVQSRPLVIDAVDISPEMLALSKQKGVYRNCIEADLCQTLPMDDSCYGAVVSAGTFTHGHVGPAAINELLRVAMPGALFCLGINARVFDANGFGSALALLQADQKISPLEFVKTQYYLDASDDHARDIGLTAVFTKHLG